MKYELQNNETGVFGVTKAYYPDGVRWYYKNPIKKEFYQTFPIFANSLEELKVKIKENNDFWFVLDGDKVKKQRKIIIILFYKIFYNIFIKENYLYNPH